MLVTLSVENAATAWMLHLGGGLDLVELGGELLTGPLAKGPDQ
jgi:hypothetical protein